MSLNFVPVVIPDVSVDDPNNYLYGVLCGGTLSTYDEVQQNNLNNSQMSIQSNVPSVNHFIDRRMYLRMGFDITLVGQSAGPGIPLCQAKGMNTLPGFAPMLANFDAPRAFPLSQVITTLASVINGVTVNTSLNNYSRLLPYFYRTKEVADTDYSLSPSMRDQAQTYAELDFTNRSPLNSSSVNTAQDPRGDFVGCMIIRNDSTGLPGDTAIIRMYCTEPLWLSPWNSSKTTQQSVGLVGIKTLQTNVTLGFRGSGPLASIGSSLWSHSTNGSALTSVSANCIFMSVLNRYITPDPTGPEPVPPNTINSFYTVTNTPNLTSLAPLNPGDTRQIRLNNIVYTQIPNKIVLVCDRRDNDCNVTTTDCFPFQIIDGGLTIQFNNQPGILSGATRQDYYNILLKHGGNMSFREWIELGGPLPLAFGDDIALTDPTLAPGVSGNFNMQMTVTIQNISASPAIPQFNVVEIDEGTFTVINGQVITNTNVLSRQDVLDAKDKEPVPYRPARSFYGAGSGSGFFDDLGNFFKKAFGPAVGIARRAASAFAPEFLPVVEGVSEVGKAFGVGPQGFQKRGGAMIAGNQLRMR